MVISTLTVNNGMTQSSTRQDMTMVSRSSVRTAEAITAEPHWDSHVVESVPELDDAIRGRTKLMHQANRRVMRGRNAEEQALIIALQNQVDHQHQRAVVLSEELARFRARAHEMHNM